MPHITHSEPPLNPDSAWHAGDRFRIPPGAWPDGVGRLFNGRYGTVLSGCQWAGTPFVLAYLDPTTGNQPSGNVYLPLSKIARRP